MTFGQSVCALILTHSDGDLSVLTSDAFTAVGFVESGYRDGRQRCFCLTWALLSDSFFISSEHTSVIQTHKLFRRAAADFIFGRKKKTPVMWKVAFLLFIYLLLLPSSPHWCVLQGFGDLWEVKGERSFTWVQITALIFSQSG